MSYALIKYYFQLYLYYIIKSISIADANLLSVLYE
jgi:hypothetical protein